VKPVSLEFPMSVAEVSLANVTCRSSVSASVSQPGDFISHFPPIAWCRYGHAPSRVKWVQKSWYNCPTATSLCGSPTGLAALFPASRAPFLPAATQVPQGMRFPLGSCVPYAFKRKRTSGLKYKALMVIIERSIEIYLSIFSFVNPFEACSCIRSSKGEGKVLVESWMNLV